jgi:XapX domain-containing protein
MRASLLIGLIFRRLNARSPAPSMMALIGVLSILMSEQLLPISAYQAGQPEANSEESVSIEMGQQLLFRDWPKALFVMPHCIAGTSQK